MIKTQTFQDLIVWQKAHKLALEIYKITKQFPKEEVYGLTSQMRRSAVSVSANVAEGYKKRGKLDKARFLNISEGSLNEIKYYLILSKDLNYLSTEYDELNQLVDEISKLLSAYIRAIHIDLKQ
jgi:four helix bundle protein